MKNRYSGIPLQTPVLLYKSGVKGGFITWTCFSDELYKINCGEISYENIG